MSHPQLPHWFTLFRCLAEHEEYKERLDGLLEVISGSTSLPTAALYLADDSESRFHLVRLRRPLSEGKKTLPAKSRRRVASLGSVLGAHLGREETNVLAHEVDKEVNPDSVTAIVASPLLDLPRREKYTIPCLVSTPLGTLYSVPLMREVRPKPGSRADEPQVEQIGIIQVGPVTGEPERRLHRQLDALAPPLAHAVALAHEHAQMADRVAAFETRADVSRQMLRSAFELDQFLTLLLDLAVHASKAEAGFISLANEEGVISLHNAVGLPEGLLDSVDLTPGTGFLDWLDETGSSLYVADFERAAELGLRTILAVPLAEQGTLLGVLGLVSFSEGHTPAAHSLTLLSVLAEQIQLVLGNIRLLELFNQQYVSTIHALACALDVRYPHTAAHHRRVTDMALEIARELGWGAGRLETLRFAGLAHDVGLCGIVEIEHGYQADFHHPTVGADMFDVLPNGQAIGEMIAAHHEWYDGWGFPDGLRGEGIPEGGRILALAEFI
ncbi:MAG: HD domain-containing phosphohydrolase, partial [Chloroflexota bacterium]|nr:HD domain-containing phosphohydrolase [Chloroflexota bacterium]